MKRITNPSGLSTDSGRLYYFTIPANSGEYALGSVSGKTGAYLCYLDIAANGGDAVLEYMKDPENANTFSVDYRSNTGTEATSTSPYCIIQIGAEFPTVTTNYDNLKITVTFVNDITSLSNDDDYKSYYPDGGGIYIIHVTNLTGQMFYLNVLLIDNNDVLWDDYTYAYRVIYTNADYEDTIITGTTLYDGTQEEVDFWQRMAIFDIPYTGEAVEHDYQEDNGP